MHSHFDPTVGPLRNNFALQATSEKPPPVSSSGTTSSGAPKGQGLQEGTGSTGWEPASKADLSWLLCSPHKTPNGTAPCGGYRLAAEAPGANNKGPGEFCKGGKWTGRIRGRVAAPTTTGSQNQPYVSTRLHVFVCTCVHVHVQVCVWGVGLLCMCRQGCTDRAFVVEGFPPSLLRPSGRRFLPDPHRTFRALERSCHPIACFSRSGPPLTEITEL